MTTPYQPITHILGYPRIGAKRGLKFDLPARRIGKANQYKLN